MVESVRFVVKPRQEAWLQGQGMRGILRGLFSRNLILVDVSMKILDEIKGRKGKQMAAKEWKEMMKKLHCSLSNYETSIGKLRRAGLVRRENEVYKISGDFSKYVRFAADIWDDWRAS